PNNPDAKHLALRTILRRKGLVLDAMANSFTALRRRVSPADQSKLDEWRSVNTGYSALALRGPGTRPVGVYRAELKELDEQRRTLENELSYRIKDLQTQIKPVTVEQVRAAIPEQAALVELYRYEPFKPAEGREEHQWGEARYVAYVLRRDGEIGWVDLG